MGYSDRCDVSVLIGKTLESICGMEKGSEQIIFTTTQKPPFTDVFKYKMYHDQDCCENVYLEDVNGDVEDLLNTPILAFDEKNNSNMEKLNEYDDSYTWTFYTIRTIKGSVDLRWYGTSNGYYSESVDFEKINNEK